MNNKISAMWSGMGVGSKLHILILSSLIILFSLTSEWVVSRFEKQVMSATEARAIETADGLINGMNMLMLTGQISNPDNRKLLLSKMQLSTGISELRIIRGESINAQFGIGLPQEQAIDEMDREVLRTGKTLRKRVDAKDGIPLLRVVVPFIALENFRGTNCLSCHFAKSGSVNGAASVTIDLSQDLANLQNVKKWLWVGYLTILAILSILISWFVRTIIVRNIAVPIKKLQIAMSEIQRENDLSKRADVDESNPDIGEMARTFNSLVMNLEHATERLELFGKMFNNSDQAMLIADENANIVAVNPAFTKITGYSEQEVIGHNPRILSSGQQGEDFYNEMWESILEKDQWQGEIWNRNKNGAIYPEWLSIGVIRNHNGEIINYISIFADITEMKAAEQKIKFLAHYDALTELPNRALFADRLEQALINSTRNKSKSALLFLDLDKFKSINDTMGHLAGDALLQSVASRLRSCVRESDTLCRQGGDEFMILIPDAGTSGAAEQVAVKIIAAMTVPHQIAGQNLIVTFSVGIAIFPDDARTAEDLIHCADEAMYRAKNSGRNNYRFFSAPL